MANILKRVCDEVEQKIIERREADGRPGIGTAECMDEINKAQTYIANMFYQSRKAELIAEAKSIRVY